MDNLLLKKDLNAEQLAMVQSEFEKKQKSKGIMYLLWWFTGALGGHRYYLGDIVRGIFMTITLGGIGFWALIDVFFIGKRIEQKNDQLEYELIKKVKQITSSKEVATTI